MQSKRFSKNDESFVCTNCGALVEPLSYTSRDHCNKCLCSIHIDIFPGDRANNCKGLFVPIAVEYNNNKGYVITYQCEKCGEIHKNKTAEDDCFETILKVMNKTYKKDSKIN